MTAPWADVPAYAPSPLNQLLTCSVCHAVIPWSEDRAAIAAHSAYHQSVADMIRALRDGKAEA